MITWISHLLLKIFGWRVEGRYASELSKVLVIVVPHTSNWDFPLGVLVRATLEANIRFVAKSAYSGHRLVGCFDGWVAILLSVDRTPILYKQ